MEFQAEFIEFSIANQVLQIRYYGIIIVVAMLVGAWIAARLAKRDGRDPDHIWGALTWAIIPAIVLARLWFVFFPSQDLVAQGKDTAWYLANFFNLTDGAIAIWSGGLSIFGAFLGGLIGAFIYLRRNKLPIAPWMDIAGVALPLGQAIGRWANFINQELYGIPTSLPWGINIDAAHRVDPYKSLVDFPSTETRFHPLFLYESLWNFLAFIVLLNIFTRYRDRLRYGDIFLLYIMQYSFIRFLLEFIRVEVTLVAGINWSQVVTAAGFVIALVVFLARRRLPAVADDMKSKTPAA
ncbi:MAG: prolipoprotein diacylglyceryl transferase [Anaerolineae bacterium]|nr:prolipoprotein diacylglyceryl transferase [Anaerolineae bacterium]NUQ03735.1 prolipoprotein diacylglyceryl transferase [Anaerolineae bacterium]